MTNRRRRRLLLVLVGGIATVFLAAWFGPWLYVQWSLFRVPMQGSPAPGYYGFRTVQWPGDRGRDAALAAFWDADPPLRSPKKLAYIVDVLREAREARAAQIAAAPRPGLERWVDVPQEPKSVETIVEAISRVPPTDENRELLSSMYLGTRTASSGSSRRRR